MTASGTSIGRPPPIFETFFTALQRQAHCPSEAHCPSGRPTALQAGPPPFRQAHCPSLPQLHQTELTVASLPLSLQDAGGLRDEVAAAVAEAAARIRSEWDADEGRQKEGPRPGVPTAIIACSAQSGR